MSQAMDPKMDETFDFIVVGSGAGSFCAALVLRAAGKSVLILEKSNLVGGTTAASGGVMWIPNNRFMREAGIEDSPEQAITYLDAVVGDHADMPGTSPERRRTYVEQSTRMLDFLVEQGIQLRRLPSWPDYFDAPGASVPGRTVVSQLFDIRQLGAWRKKLRPGFLPLPANLDEAMQLPLLKRSKAAKKILIRIIGRALSDLFSGRKRATAGHALQGQMLYAALKAGADIRLNAHVEELLVEAGRVTGVRVKQDGAERSIKAGLGVLVNAGGFARNQRMLDLYIPGTKTEWSSCPDVDTGEMIEAVARIGAVTAQMKERLGMPIALPPGSEAKPVKPGMQNDVARPHAIVVNQSGARYLNEANDHVELCRRMLEHGPSANPSWMVFDSQYLNNQYMLAGTFPKSKTLKAWQAAKFLYSGDTLDALATACGMDGAALHATVKRFNGFVRAGRDTDFHRGESAYGRWVGDPLNETSNTLGTIEQGPFHAVKLLPGDVSTFGGLVTDSHARVLREDGTVIPGLYATGTSTASVMGPIEPGPGGSIGPAMTWGYVAAQHAINT